MKSLGRTARLGVWLGGSLLLALAVTPRMPAHAATGVVIRDLGAPGSDFDTFAYDVNQLGAVAGSVVSFDNGFSVSPLEWLAAKPIKLPKPTGTFSEAFGISDNNLLTGYADEDATLWKGTTLKILPRLPGGSFAEGFDVNTSSIAVGQAGNANDDGRPVCWDASGQILDLGSLPGRTFGVALRVNNKSQIVGFTGFPLGAMLWDHGAIIQLQGFGGQRASFAEGINDKGVITGYVEDADFSLHAVVWQNGAVRPLPEPFIEESVANGINGKGQIVGQVLDDNFDVFGALWNGAQVIELENLLPPNSGWEFLVPQAINDQGVIVGYGFKDGLGLRGFSLTVS